MNISKARFRFVWSLVFLIVAGCAETAQDKSVTIQWEGRKAVGLVIPQTMLPGFQKDSINQLLHVQLMNSNASILGDYEVQNDSVVFRPLIAFTRGLKYKLIWRDRLLKEIEILEDSTRENPKIVAIYPTGDSLPVNLLKMYIVFSKPMQEGDALENIVVIRNEKDTLSSVFLDLQPELWNKERTILTIWLDPGRTKRDLQPNKAMGSPLQTGNHYEVLVKPGWMDAEGAELASGYRKHFCVTVRDNQSPDPQLWTIHSPRSGTTDALKIELHEALDYLVLKNAVSIIDSAGNVLSGEIVTDRNETVLLFTPSNAWVSGEYTVEVEPKLEDLAGNNLQRLFDKDLSHDSADRKIKVYKRIFHVR
ncbi:MAG: Ig-like domain-containing protein [Chitinophagaceae bacterium]